MEETLQQLSREIVTPKFAAIKHSCSAALNVLQNEETLQATEAWKLRELCLEPFQMALESRARKLSYHALAGIQHLLKDERFHSSLETGDEEHWLPVQVLNALHLTPQLPEEIQVEIMKLLLHMTLTTAWCMNASIVIKISQLFLKCYCHSPRSKTGRLAATMFRESVGEWCSLVHGSNSSTETIRSLLAHIGTNHRVEEENEEEEEENSSRSDEAETSPEVKKAVRQCPHASVEGVTRGGSEKCVRILRVVPGSMGVPVLTDFGAVVWGCGDMVVDCVLFCSL